jgi:hypothetical protein
LDTRYNEDDDFPKYMKIWWHSRKPRISKTIQAKPKTKSHPNTI